MKEIKLNWYEIPCGSFRVGTWATSERKAKAKVAAVPGFVPAPLAKRYGQSAKSTVCIVL